MGAGILPVALYRGTLYLLLGQERHNSLWSDFGGSSHKRETPFKTAIREGTEELNGFLGTEEEMEELSEIAKALDLNDPEISRIATIAAINSALADGQVSEAERILIHHAATPLGFSDEQFKAIDSALSLI